MIGLRNVNSTRKPPANYLKELIDKIYAASIATRNTLRMAQHLLKRDCNTRAPVREVTFDVYIRNSSTVLGLSKKLLPIWKSPFVITTLCHVSSIAGCKMEYIKHDDKRSICEDRDIPLWVRQAIFH